MQEISLSPWPHYAEDEIAAVQEVLASGRVNYWTGDQGRQFEREYANFVGVEHSVAVANGTVALELALRALDIGPGDEVIVTPRTFIASASSIVTCGATPVFADIDRDSQNITAATIASCLTHRTRAIILVHLAGWPCEMAAILELAQRHELKIIEDCAQAHGARYNGQAVGSFGDVSVFSFCQDKIISTGGEGGMLLTHSKQLWQKAWSYKDHGKNYATVHQPHSSDGEPFRWVHDSFGSNFRMTEMQAAIGRIQLRKLDTWKSRRTENAQILREGLSGLAGLRIPAPGPNIDHAFYKFYAFVIPDRLRPGWNRNRIISAISRLGAPCFGGSCSEVYREKAFSESPFHQTRRLPVAKELGESSLMFPVHPTLTPDTMAQIVDIVVHTMTQAQT